MLQVWTGEVVGRGRGAGGGGDWARGPRDTADSAAQRQGRVQDRHADAGVPQQGRDSNGISKLLR